MATKDESEFIRRLREVIRDLRKAKGLTQRELAEQLSQVGWDVDVTGLSKIESGTRNVTIGEMDMIGTVLGASVYEIIKSAESPPDAHKALLDFWDALDNVSTTRQLLNRAYGQVHDLAGTDLPEEVRAEIEAVVALLRPADVWPAVGSERGLSDLMDAMRARLNLEPRPRWTEELRDGEHPEAP